MRSLARGGSGSIVRETGFALNVTVLGGLGRASEDVSDAVGRRGVLSVTVVAISRLEEEAEGKVELLCHLQRGDWNDCPVLIQL